MKTKLLFLIPALVVLFACENTGSIPAAPDKTDPGDPDTCIITTKLIADGPNYDDSCDGTEVGEVVVVDNGDSITVTYNATAEGWVINITQMYIGLEPDIPANGGGNPIPGQFPYINVHDPGVTTFTIGPLVAFDTNYVVVARADVEELKMLPVVDSLCGILPDTVDFIFTEKGPDSYLNIDVFNGDLLDGTYNGWCINRDYSISDGNIYEDAAVYCSYDSLPDGLVDHPENIDLINWIINNVSAGQVSVCGGNYTYGDIQRAVWKLMDDDSTNLFGLGEWSQCRADEIVNNAMLNGEGFKPVCDDDYLGVILDGENVQTNIIAVPYPCSISLRVGAAWGYGQNGEYCDTEGADGISFTDSEYYGGAVWGWYFYGCE